MKYRIELHPSAVQELSEAFEWYEGRSPGLGHRFIEAIDKRFSEISDYPDRYPKRKEGFREIPIRIFPYIIIYEFFSKEKVVFVSYIFHTKRNPTLKYRRKR